MISSLNPDYSKRPPDRKKIGEIKKVEGSKKKPEVSIITAFYNTGSIFWETFYSITNQTFTDFEWLIVNDSSTKEESLTILSEVEALDNRITVINNPQNMGLGLTRNNGAKHAKGSFLFFIDSDDLVEYSFLEKCVLCLQLNSNFTFVGPYTIGFEAKEYLWRHGYLQPIKFFEANYAVNCFVCRRFIFDIIEYTSDRGGMEDWDFWLNAASRGFWGYTIPEFLYWYRERKNRADDWPNLFNEIKNKAFIDNLHLKYNQKVKHQTFEIKFSKNQTDCLKSEEYNSALSTVSRMVFIIDYSVNSSQIKLIKDYVQLFKNNGAIITVVITSLNNGSYNGEFLEITDDVFILDHLAAKSKHPQLLEYLIATRNIGRVIAVNLDGGLFFAPYLKDKFNRLQFDALIISVKKNQQIKDLVELYNLNTSFIDNIGASSSSIKLFLESDSELYGKTYYVPPVTSESIQPFSTNFSFYQKFKLNISPATFVITSVGQISSSPEYFSIHHVIEQLNKENIHNYVFVFFGWGALYQNFHSYIHDHKIQNKVYLMNVNPMDSQLWDNFAISDIYLDMPVQNGYSDEIRYALYKGLPIVSVGNELMKDIIDPGFSYCGNENKQDIAHFIAKSIISLIHSPGLQNKLRRNNIAKALTILQKENHSALKFCKLEKRANEKAPSTVDTLTKNILILN